MKLALIFRKRNPLFFSIERVFEIIQKPLQALLPVEFIQVPQKGVNMKNLLFLQNKKAQRKNDKQLFHVTGDIHYAVFVLPRNRTILTIHDCVFMESYTGIKRWLLKKLLLDWPLSYTKYITAISQKTKEDIIQLTGCSPEKIRVIPNPVAGHIHYEDKAFNNEKPVLLFLGSTPNKNLDRVIPAIKGINCHLHIVGKPTDPQKEALKNSGIDHTIEQGLTDLELANCFTKADIILFPTLYEGFGLPVIEGYKAGRVVLTSNIAPLNEIAAGAACLVDPTSIDSIREGLSRLISNKNYREELIQKGFTIVNQYLPEQIAQQYFNLYKEVMQHSCVE
jgi:glycosyltransferase involved in cell wall biosynthesis